MSRIAILGSGAWGTALAINLTQRGGHRVTLWSRSAAAVDQMRDRRENAAYLPNFPLPAELHLTADPATAVAEAEILVAVVPSEHLRATCEHFAPFLHQGQIFVTASKGLEDRTLLRMSEVIQQTLAARNLNLPIGALSGPSFAQEVAAGAPTALTIAFPASSSTGAVPSTEVVSPRACPSSDSVPSSVKDTPAARIQRDFSGASLRLYANHDLVGVELGGALKNVIAIASGVATGLGLGHNATAALITRGIAEITRLALACGGRRETLSGLSGIGDLVLTCTGALSRNRLVGIELGRGRNLPDILASLNGKVAEGVRTTAAARDLAQKHRIEMPITEQMAAILGEKQSPTEAMRELMSRPNRDE